LIEFFPYKYDCRDWYRQLAAIFRIQHFAGHTLNINQSRWDPKMNATKLAACQRHSECLRGRCHDLLRDQSIIVDIDQYKRITRPFFDQFHS
jgi:hypothetical protein